MGEGWTAWVQFPTQPASLTGSGPVALGLDDVSQELVGWGLGVLPAWEATEKGPLQSATRLLNHSRTACMAGGKE